MVHHHKPMSTELVNATGTIDFNVMRRDRTDEDVGELQICIRASKGGSKNAIRFALFIEEVDLEEVEVEEEVEKVDVDSHLTFIEDQLFHYEKKMHVMLRTADLVREHDAIYHKKADAMYQATIFWPIVHVGILLLTGFTQAQHIVSFFKQRRII
jgi:hypothetical protein